MYVLRALLQSITMSKNLSFELPEFDLGPSINTNLYDNLVRPLSPGDYETIDDEDDEDDEDTDISPYELAGKLGLSEMQETTHR